VDLGLTYTFCQQLHEILRTAAAAKKSVVYYCANHPHKRANSAVLLLAYLVSPFRTSQIFSIVCQFLQQVAIEIAILLVDLLSDER
jgi:Dual specificity protein phosphatase, N-terminal half